MNCIFGGVIWKKSWVLTRTLFEYIEDALSLYDVELIHFVNPGLMYRVTSDENFEEVNAQKRVKEQIEVKGQFS